MACTAYVGVPLKLLPAHRRTTSLQALGLCPSNALAVLTQWSCAGVCLPSLRGIVWCVPQATIVQGALRRKFLALVGKLRRQVEQASASASVHLGTRAIAKARDVV